MKSAFLSVWLLLCSGLAAWAQAPAQNPAPAAQNAPAAGQPAPAQPPEEDQPERLEERAYVRKFSLGYSLNLTPFNLMPKTTQTEKIDGTTPIQNDSSMDPKSNRFGWSFTAQYALSERWAIAVAPAYRNVAFHTFIQSYAGVDNSSTFIDERAKTEINEDTTARFLDIPLLARRYSKGRHESGPRWFYEAGGVVRRTNRVNTEFDVVPPKGDRYRYNGTIDYTGTTYGVTAGIGGQFIDDFGIRAIPEVRYTYWLGKPFDSIHGTTRVHQIEMVITFAF